MEKENLIKDIKSKIEEKNYKEAESIIKDILDKEIYEDKEIYYYYAEILDKFYDKYLEAIDYYKKCLNYNLIELKKVEINYKIGELYILQQEKLNYENKKQEIRNLYNKGKKYFKKSRCKKYNQYFIDSTIYLGECHEMLGEFEKAIKILLELKQNYILDDKDEKEVNITLGACYFNLNKFEDAITYLKKVDKKIIDYDTISAIKLLSKSYLLVDNPLKSFETIIYIFKYKKKKPEMITKNDLDTVLSILEDIIERVFIKDKEIQNEIKNIMYKLAKDDSSERELIEMYGKLCLKINPDIHPINKHEVLSICNKAINMIDNKQSNLYKKLNNKIKELE